MTGHNNPSRRANKATQADRRAQAFKLRLAGHSIRDVARLMRISPTTAQKYINLEVDDVVVPLREEMRKQELARLDALYVKATQVLERDHVHISEGRVVRDKDPETGDSSTILDDGPTLQAIDRALKILDRRAKLLGLDEAQKIDANVTEHVDPASIPLRGLIEAQQEKNAAAREALASDQQRGST